MPCTGWTRSMRRSRGPAMDAGTLPLVTPTSQIVGVQAVMNVVSGRYKMISNQFGDLMIGLYGKTPTPVDPEVQKLVLKRRKGQTPITGYERESCAGA